MSFAVPNTTLEDLSPAALTPTTRKKLRAGDTLVFARTSPVSGNFHHRFSKRRRQTGRTRLLWYNRLFRQQLTA